MLLLLHLRGSGSPGLFSEGQAAQTLSLPAIFPVSFGLSAGHHRFVLQLGQLLHAAVHLWFRQITWVLEQTTLPIILSIWWERSNLAEAWRAGGEVVNLHWLVVIGVVLIVRVNMMISLGSRWNGQMSYSWMHTKGPRYTQSSFSFFV